MNNLLPESGYLSALKKYILTKAGIQSLTPGDCRIIALRIKETTGKIVSETTLKRFLGFAKKNYNFSAYTLNALCDYIGFSGWEAFKKSVGADLPADSSVRDVWADFHKKSRKVSAISLQSLKDHSGIPFQYTVSRAAIDTDFEIFMEEDYPCFGLIGDAGMGKSIQMAHLAENFFLKDDALYKDSICWLFKKGALFDFIPHDIYLEETLYEQFGLRAEFNFIEYFRNNPDKVKGRLVIMLDGFDENLYRTETQEKIFQQFSDLLSYLRDIKWVKFIFSMQPATWDILKAKMNSAVFMRNKWFPGTSFQRKLNANLGRLLPSELEKIFDQSSVPFYNKPSHLYSLLLYPVFLTAYFQQLERGGRSGSAIGDVMTFKLISSYLGDRVHRTSLDVEKWLIIKRMLQQSITDKGCRTSIVESSLLHGLFEDSNHIAAYREMLRCGLLKREKEYSDDYTTAYKVSFSDVSLHVFLLSSIVIGKHQRASIEELIATAKEKYHICSKQTLLLKSIFWHLLDNRTPGVWNALQSDCLTVQDKAELILFLADYVHASPQTFSKEDKTAFCRIVITFFANQLFYVDALNDTYDKALKYLIGICPSDIGRMNLLIIYSILSLLRLNQEAMNEALDLMRRIPISKDKYPVHPVEMVEYLLKGKGFDIFNNGSLPPPLSAFIEDGKAFLNKKVNCEMLLSYQLTGLILQMRFETEYFLVLTGKIRQIHSVELAEKKYPELQTLLEIQELFSYDFSQNTSKIQSFIYLNGQFSAAIDKVGNTSNFDAFRLLLHGDALVQKDTDAGIACYRKSYKLCQANHYELLQIMTSLRLIKHYKNSEEFEHPVSLIREVRKKTAHLTLPIRDLFLQKVMLEAD